MGCHSGILNHDNFTLSAISIIPCDTMCFIYVLFDIHFFVNIICRNIKMHYQRDELRVLKD